MCEDLLKGDPDQGLTNITWIKAKKKYTPQRLKGKDTEVRNMEPDEMRTLEITKMEDKRETFPKKRGKTFEMEKTDEEPEIIYRGWKTMPLIIGNETFEKLGTIGTTSNLLIYLTTVFNMKSVTAATIINIFSGTCNFGTIFGAFLSDTYFGRFKTIAFATLASLVGLLVIDLTAAIPKLHPAPCGNQGSVCTGATAGQIFFLMAGFVLLIIGASGIRPCNLAFGADQFDPNTDSGKKGIKSFFNWYFFTFTFAQMVSVTLIVYIQSNVSWAIGYGIPVILMLLSSVLFFIGAKMFVRVKASGSPFTSITQVIVVSIRKRHLQPLEKPSLTLYNYISPKSTNLKLPYTDQFRCLDKAAIRTPEDEINEDGSRVDPWRLCSMQQVEELKCLVRVMPIWASAIIFYITVVQQHTYGVFQALQSDRKFLGTKFTIPAASYSIFVQLSYTICIPLFGRVVVPMFKKLTGKEKGITLLQRQGAGIIFSTLTMLISGFVEKQRRTIALTRPTLGHVPRRGEISSMSAFWLVPQLTLTGISEALASIGQAEFFYTQVPENMRSVAGSLFYVSNACSSYMSGFLISLVHRTTENSAGGDWLSEDLNNGKLDYYYYMIVGLGILNLAYFLLCAKWYKYKEADVNGESKSEKSLA